MVEMSTKQMVTKQQKNNFIITKGEGIREVDLFMLLPACFSVCVCVCLLLSSCILSSVQHQEGKGAVAAIFFLKMLGEESSFAACCPSCLSFCALALISASFLLVFRLLHYTSD